MIPLLTSHRAELSALCRRFHVSRLDIFGSAARGTDFTPESDFDFLVEFEEGYPRSFGEYMDLRGALEALFGREVDLTMASAVRNPYIRAAIDRSRELLYAA
jgi:predicted nucleotidyltransferase